MVGHTAFETQESYPILLPSVDGKEGHSFPGLVESDDKANLKALVGITLGDYSVVIRYKADKFTHTWLVKCSFA